MGQLIGIHRASGAERDKTSKNSRKDFRGLACSFAIQFKAAAAAAEKKQTPTSDYTPPNDEQRTRMAIPNNQLYHRYGNFLKFSHPQRDEGWKLHMPIKQDSEGEFVFTPYILEILVSLQARKIPHKVVATRSAMKALQNDNQDGKFLTIYPSSIEEWRLVHEDAQRLYGRLNNNDNPATAKNELDVGANMTTRYGGFTSEFVLTPKALKEDERPDEANCYIHDDKNTPKPGHIAHPLEDSGGFEGFYDHCATIKEDRIGVLRIRRISDAPGYNKKTKRYGWVSARPSDKDKKNL